MSQISKKIRQTIWILAVVGLGFIVLGCASSNYQPAQLTDIEIEKLKDLWLESSNIGDRYMIVQEFEKRKSLDGLLFCLYWATRQLSIKSVQSPPPGQYHPWASSGYKYHPGQGYKRARSKTRSNLSKKDAIEIVQALGRIKNPEAVTSLRDSFHRVQDTELKMIILDAFQKIDSPEAKTAIMQSLKDPDPKIRFLALYMVGRIKSSVAMQAVLPVLLDEDANIRFAAVHILGEIGDPRAAGRIGFLELASAAGELLGDVLGRLRGGRRVAESHGRGQCGYGP